MPPAPLYLWTLWRYTNAVIIIISYVHNIAGIRHYEHITPILRGTVYWLPISPHITFKIALMIFRWSCGRCPKYCTHHQSCVHSCTHCCCSFAIAISIPQRPRCSTCIFHSVWLPQFLHVRTNHLEQTSTGSAKHRH